jgi:hypothetical protein
MTFLREGCPSFTLSPMLFSQNFMLRNGMVAFMIFCWLSINISVVSMHNILSNTEQCVQALVTQYLRAIWWWFLLKILFFSVTSGCADAFLWRVLRSCNVNIVMNSRKIYCAITARKPIMIRTHIQKYMLVYIHKYIEYVSTCPYTYYIPHCCNTLLNISLHFRRCFMYYSSKRKTFLWTRLNKPTYIHWIIK